MPHSAKRQMPALPRPRKTRISNVLCLFMRRYIFIVTDHNIFVSKSLQIDGGIHVYVDIKMGVPKYNRKMRVADTVGVAWAKRIKFLTAWITIPDESARASSNRWLSWITIVLYYIFWVINGTRIKYNVFRIELIKVFLSCCERSVEYHKEYLDFCWSKK